jgi:epsilon-lactone hydrolase
VAAYRALLDRGIPAQRIAVAGDSAGGGLSLVVGLTAVLEQLPVPGVLGLICPGVDGGPDALGSLPDVTKDAVLTKAMVTSFLTAYLDGLNPDLPTTVVSPLHADLAGLPPLVIDTGADDLIVSQARDLAAKARAAGVEVHYREHPGLWHVFHALVGILPQADRAVDDLAAQLARRINPRPGEPGRNRSAHRTA